MTCIGAVAWVDVDLPTDIKLGVIASRGIWEILQSVSIMDI